MGNIGPRSFLYGPRRARSVLPRPRANIPQYGPRARLVRGYSWRPCLKIYLKLRYYFKLCRLNLDLKSVSEDACLGSIDKLFHN